MELPAASSLIAHLVTNMEELGKKNLVMPAHKGRLYLVTGAQGAQVH